MQIKSVIYTIEFSDLEYKKLILELEYFLKHNSYTSNKYVFDEDPIADANLRDSEDYLLSVLQDLKHAKS